VGVVQQCEAISERCAYQSEGGFYHNKVLIVLSVSLGLVSTGFLPKEAVAKMKKETQHDIFKKLKLNASMTSAAEVMYGKNYKKHLCDRSLERIILVSRVNKGASLFEPEPLVFPAQEVLFLHFYRKSTKSLFDFFTILRQANSGYNR